MAANKTQATTASVSQFLAAIDDEQQRRDAKALDKLFRRVTGEKPKLWGSSIVGYGSYHYRYDSGREGDFARTGFSPRKQSLVLYLMQGFSGYEALLGKLGPYKNGKSCLYIKRLADVDLAVLEELLTRSYREMARQYPA